MNTAVTQATPETVAGIGRVKKNLLRIAAAVVLASGSALVAVPQADAATTCRYTNYWLVGGASGGCSNSAPFRAGHDRMVIQCSGLRGSVLYITGPWRARYYDWAYSLWCPGGYGYRTSAVWFDHTSS
ncbi:hypothetical protein PROP_02220 [Propionicimonas sp. T2.31MG-18]|jgi:hypothetical protein